MPAMMLAPVSIAASESSADNVLVDLNDNRHLDVDPNKLLSQLKTLQDQIAVNSVRLSLHDAVAKGVQNNPDLSNQFAQLQQQEWTLISNKRKWNPQLSISNGPGLLSYNWNTYVVENYARPTALNGETWKKLKPQGRSVIASSQRKNSAQSQSLDFNPSATIQWSFYDPSRQPGINSAQNTLDQRKYLLDQAARNLVSSIQVAYFQVQKTRQLIDSFSDIYEINKKQLDILEARLSIGMADVAMVEQQRSQLYIQLTTLVVYTNNYIRETASLAQLLALPADGSLAIPSELAKPQGIWTKSLDETVKDALNTREDILALSSEAEATKWQGIALLRKYLPVFSLVVSGGLTSSKGYPKTYLGIDPGPGYQTNRNWSMSAGIGFNWQFDGGQNAANAQAYFANSRSILSRKAMTEDQAVSEVRATYGRMKTSIVAIQAARQSYRSALLAQEAARARFDVGVGDITAVVQTVNQLSDASTQLASAIFNYNSSVSQLYKYSATWPRGSKNEYIQRIDSLRENPSL